MAKPVAARVHVHAIGQWLLLAALGVLATFAGCRDKPDTASPADASIKAEVATGSQGTPAALPSLGPDPPTRSAALALLGDFRSFTQPCGCTPEQPGGFVRLATIFAAAREISGGGAVPAGIPEPAAAVLAAALTPPVERIWPIECGNFAWVGGRFQDDRLRTHLDSLGVLGARAAVLGAGELQLREADAQPFADSPVPLVSANLTLKQPFFELQRYVELAPGWYVSGLSSWQPLTGTVPQESWWALGDPVAAAKSVLAELPPGSRLILIAAYQPDSVYAELRKLPLAALIGPGSWRLDKSNEEIGESEVAQMPAAGRDNLRWPAELPAPPHKAVFLPFLLLDAAQAPPDASARFIEVTQDWPDSPAAKAVIDAQNERLQARARQQREELAAAYGDSGFGMAGQFLPEAQQAPDAKLLRVKLDQPALYSGSDSCASCHSAADAAWRASLHSHALKTLADHGEQQNLDCLQCHVVGLYELGGFNPDEPLTQLGSVGCENCHGPGSQHIAAAKLAELEGGQWPAPAEQWQGARYSIERSSMASCLKCHDPYNSPNFEPATYWSRIAH